MRFKLFIICVIVLFAFSIAGAANRVMIPLDTIHTYIDSFDLPIAFENDENLLSVSHGFVITTSGPLTAEFVEDPYVAPGSRAVGTLYWLFMVGVYPDRAGIGCYLMPGPPFPPGDLEIVFYFPIETHGGEGEICVDSGFYPPAGVWVWDNGEGNLNPSFNDGNGPHCIARVHSEICGDANGDGLVNVSDPVYIINYIFLGGPPPPYYYNGDANCDGTVNISDVVWIKNYIFQGGRAPCDTNWDGVPDC